MKDGIWTWSRAVSLAVPLGVIVAALVSSCGTGKPDAAVDGTSFKPAFCGTPNSGCDCPEAGKVVECGNVELRSGDYVSCSVGHRTCLAGNKWGECEGTNIVTKRLAAMGVPGALHGLTLGTTMTCPAPPAPTADPCDPYCNQFVDDPTGVILGGGLTVSGGGITVLPPAPPLFTGNTGDSACPGGTNVHSNPCLPTPYQSCQQDFRCTGANTCVWNGGPGYSDAACAGVDLTIGAGCDNGTNQVIPLCNRGTTTVATGTTIGINILNPAQFSSWNTGACPSLGAPTCTHTLTAPLAAGQCVSVTECSWSGNRYAVVNAGAAPIAECAGRCANNGAYIKVNGPPGCAACGGACVTQLFGTITDPRGVNPVYGATVYVPSGAVAPIPAGVGCDTCASLTSPYSTLAITRSDGTFTLQGVPSGVAFPLVIQTGRWRRQITVPAIAACGSGTLTPALSHLPTTQKGGVSGAAGEGDIPQFAMVTGQGDQLECLLRKVGVADTEFTDPTGAGRVHMFVYNGSSWPAAPSPQGVGKLWDTPALLNNYSAMILPCHNLGPPWTLATGANLTNMLNWVNVGGRLFASHHWHEFIYRQPAATGWPGTENLTTPLSTSDGDRPAPDLPGSIDMTFPDGQAMGEWLLGVGASTTLGSLTVQNWRHETTSVNPTGKQWIYGDSSLPPVSHGAGVLAGPLVSIMSFDAPPTALPAAQCGRVIIPQMHVSQYGNGASFGTCPAPASAMSAQEAAFEFMMFESTACLGLIVPPPPLVSATFTRDYQAVCPVGTRVTWQFFYWEGTIPGGTNIAFRAATAATAAALPPAPPGAAPTTVSIGNATVTTLAPAWAQDARTVADHLYNDLPGPGVKSAEFLRVYMTFNPTATVSPILTNWRQTYDCVPAE